MNDFKEKVLNGLANVVLIGLPIALVLIFGEKFSLWINFLAIGCLFLVSSILFGLIIGDDNEHPRRVLHALIGAAIALSLKVLVYPGHTVMIIIVTILIICTADLINRGHVLCFRFFRSSRLNFLGKFILLATLLFIISLVIANFGSQKIWIPIVTASGIILLLLVSDSYLETIEFDEDYVIYVSIGALLLTGLISTIIQFSSVEIFWGIELWEAIVALVVTVIGCLTYIVIKKRMKRVNDLIKFRQENEAKQRESEEASKARKEKEDAEKAQIEAGIKRRLEEIEASAKTLSVVELSFLYNYDTYLGAKLIFEKDINVHDFCQAIKVSNHKRKIVWDRYMRDSFSLLAYASGKEFNDEKLSQILDLLTAVRAYVFGRKTEVVEYDGEKILEEILKEIEDLIHPE